MQKLSQILAEIGKIRLNIIMIHNVLTELLAESKETLLKYNTMKFQINQKVTVFDNKGIISDTTDAPKQYGVTFDATGKTYAV